MTEQVRVNVFADWRTRNCVLNDLVNAIRCKRLIVTPRSAAQGEENAIRRALVRTAGDVTFKSTKDLGRYGDVTNSGALAENTEVSLPTRAHDIAGSELG
jgi:hypothetical protein